MPLCNDRSHILISIFEHLNNDMPQVKSIIFARGGVSGLRGLCSYLKRMDRSGSGLLERSELCECLANFGLDADDGPGGDIDRVMGFFDRDGEGRINIREFHRGLRVRMLKTECSLGCFSVLRRLQPFVYYDYPYTMVVLDY